MCAPMLFHLKLYCKAVECLSSENINKTLSSQLRKEMKSFDKRDAYRLFPDSLTVMIKSKKVSTAEVGGGKPFVFQHMDDHANCFHRYQKRL